MKKVFLVYLIIFKRGNVHSEKQYVSAVFKSFDNAVSYGKSLVEEKNQSFPDRVHSYRIAEYIVS